LWIDLAKQLGVSEPIFGRLFAEECRPLGKRHSAACFANLAVEGELAVLLGDDLSGPSVTEDDCRAAIASTFPVIELHHYVLPAAWPRIQWLIASGGLHAGFIRPEADAPGDGIAQSLTVRVNDNVVGDVQDATSLVSPVRSLHWLAGRLADVGLRLHPGQVILTGSPLPLFPVGPGSRVVVEAPPLESCCVEIDPSFHQARETDSWRTMARWCWTI
jgi:2-keto-4-pentenoate hydratase